ncbi:hypothetical protein Vretimale_14656, partial [Volvox reticuliferus]
PPLLSLQRRSSLQSASGSHSAGAPSAQQHYPLAEAIIAFATAAANGELPASTAAEQVPSRLPAPNVQHQHQHQLHPRGAQVDHSLMKQGYGHEHEAGVEEYSPGVVQRTPSGAVLPRQSSASDSGARGGGWHEEARAVGFWGSREVMAREAEPVYDDDDDDNNDDDDDDDDVDDVDDVDDDDEPDAKKLRPGP